MSSAALARRLARQAAAGVGRRARSTEAAGAAGCPFHRAVPLLGAAPAQGAARAGHCAGRAPGGGRHKIHEYCDRRHRELGPIYRETLGSVDAVFVADSALIQKVYTNEGKFPMHMVPEAWLIYNEVKGIQRGLFFM
ncbi:hypothetical protein HPB48_005876 [Haemaphysalis longicornis]|uniref:Uncharacterized protein n=1 Tax=Haemaphysalis longicornis TaxID=44386 RepID=A0A9J6GPQ3_HAELO|nr:hypothetical protein HPB48_005876 [Haemaphysalis longicornis]